MAGDAGERFAGSNQHASDAPVGSVGLQRKPQYPFRWSGENPQKVQAGILACLTNA